VNLKKVEDKLQQYIKFFFYSNYEKYKKIHKKNYKFFYNNILIILTNELNKIHNLDLTKKQWAIIVGPWLDNILNIYFFYKTNFIKFKKFLFIKQLKKKSSQELKKFNLFYFTYNDFVENINTKEFHYTAISLILNKESYKFLKVKKVFLNKTKFIKIIYLKFIKFFFSNKIILHSKSRFTLLDQFLLILKSRFKIFPLPVMENTFEFQLINTSNDRKKIINNINKNNKNFKVIKFLLFFMPSAYLENFKDLKKIGNKNLIVPRKFYTDSTHLFDEILKIQLAEWSKNKFTKIMIGQHGGNTRIYEDALLSYNEFMFCNSFITWGYKKNRHKEVYLPSIRLNNFYRNNSKFKTIKKYEICYILKPLVKDIFKSNFIQNINPNYIDEKIKFFKEINQNLIIKSYSESKRYKNQISNKALAKLFNVKNKQIKKNFQIIFESKILIFDYVSTMIFEMINLNKPIILILNKKDQYLSNYGKIFLKDLERLGILLPSHEHLITLSKKNPNYFRDYDRDWNMKSKQNLIKKFCKEYAHLQKNFLEIWKNYLIKR
jgi:putative transferase (TIGR04331 family)